MSPLGLKLTRAISQASDQVVSRYERAPASVRQSFLPFALLSIPLLIGTALAPVWMAPLIEVLTMVLLYQVAESAESTMFAVDKIRAHLAVTMPMCGFISAWGIALALAGRPMLAFVVVGPYSLLLLLACAPAYRLSDARATRYIALRHSFPVLAALAFLASLKTLKGA